MFNPKVQDNTYILKYLRVPEGNAELFLQIVLTVVIIALFLIIFHYVWRNLREKKLHRMDVSRFLILCRRCKLTAKQIAFLKRMKRIHRIQRFSSLLREREIFDKIMAWEVERYASAHPDRKEKFKNYVLGLRRKIGFADFDTIGILPSTRYVPENLPVKISFEAGGHARTIEGSVKRVDEEVLVLSLDPKEDERIVFHKNQKINVMLIHRDDAEYDFLSTVLRFTLGIQKEVELRHSHTCKRMQRRRYERIDVEIPMRYFVFTHYADQEFRLHRTIKMPLNQVYNSGVLKNLSGGGCSFESSKSHRAGSYICLAFYLDNPDYELDFIVGQVVRSDETERGRYETTLHFIKIDEASRDLIVRFASNTTKEKSEDELAEEKNRADKEE